MSARDRELQQLTGGDPVLRIGVWGMLLYLTIYTFESPLRYLLHLAHASSLIVGRDLLILGPIALLGVRGVLKRDLHPAILVFTAFVCVGGMISVLNFGSLFAAALGTKMLANVVLGLIVGAALIIPDRLTARFLVALWLATVVGLVLEKYFVKFPWIGVRAIIGGVQVEISRDWQVADPDSQRVGGFTKQSISAASLVAQLALIAFFQFRSYFLRVAILAVSIGCIYLTTQKGAVIGMILVSLVLCGPANLRVPALRVMVVVALLLNIGLPLLTNGLVMQQGHGGVFSGASFAQRIDDTWPHSLTWISQFEIFPFGIGLGGIGAAQQLAGSIAQHYPDNIFLLLYAFFGMFSLLLFGWIGYAAIRSINIDPEVAAPALAVLAFNLLYGIVVTVLEDQAGALLLGSSVGVLLYASRVLRTRPAIQPFRAAPAT